MKKVVNYLVAAVIFFIAVLPLTSFSQTEEVSNKEQQLIAKLNEISTSMDETIQVLTKINTEMYCHLRAKSDSLRNFISTKQSSKKIEITVCEKSCTKKEVSVGQAKRKARNELEYINKAIKTFEARKHLMLTTIDCKTFE